MPARGYELDEAVRALKEAVRKLDLKTARTRAATGTAFDGTGSGSPETDVQAELDRLEGLVGAAAPNDADYLVGTANADLTSEIVVGTTPGGELGGTWASPTVHATHSGSAHADAIAKSLLTTRGDLIRRGAAVPERVGLGADGRLLASDGTDAVWEAQYATVIAVIDGGGVAITTGVKLDIGPFDFAGVIEAASLLADQSGSIVVDIWKDVRANYPPTVGDSITSATPPTITTATNSQDTTLSSWITAIAIGDTIRLNVNSITTIQRVQLALKVRKT